MAMLKHLRRSLLILWNIKSKSAIANIITLVKGNLIAYVVTVIAYFILPKFYTPDKFGNLGVFIGISTILFTLSTGRLERAILLPKKDLEALDLTKLAMLMAFFVNLLAFLIILVFKKQFFKYFPFKGPEWLIYFIPLFSLFLAFIEILTFFLNRKEAYKEIALAKIINSIVNFISSLTIGLVFGEIFGRAISLFYMFRSSIKSFYHNKNIKNPKKYLFKYKSFLTKTTPAAIIGTFGNNIPLLALAKIYDPALLGQYVIAIKILSIPVALTGKAISQVFYKKGIEINTERTLQPFIQKTSLLLFTFISIIMLFVFIFVKRVINEFYGHEWVNTSLIIKLLIPYFITNFVYTCQSTTLYIKEKQGYELVYNIFLLISQLFVFVLAYKFSLTVTTTFVLMSISLSLINIFSLFYIIKISK